MKQLAALLIAIFCLAAFTGDAAARKIFVKIYVDEEEPAARAAWEKRLGDRLKRASEIIKPLCDIEFVVHGFHTWQSDNRLTDFSKSLTDFQKKAPPAPATMSLGFSSQYKFTRGRHHMGGIRGPLNPWILIRESNPRVNEDERVEVLVHELGHYLGAAHSPIKTSVMRPVVGDGQARAKRFTISFDKNNAELIRLVGREIRDLGVTRFVDLTPETRRRIRTHYHRLALQMPTDPAARMFLKVINRLEQLEAAHGNRPKYPGPIIPGLEKKDPPPLPIIPRPPKKKPIPGPIIPAPKPTETRPIIPGPIIPRPDNDKD